MSTFSTHVLDAAEGRPAAGLKILLVLPDGTEKKGVTDADGRARVDSDLAAGDYRVTFHSGEWFAGQDRATFHPRITVDFTMTAGEHHHVALLLSPFAYTTYRGS